MKRQIKLASSITPFSREKGSFHLYSRDINFQVFSADGDRKYCGLDEGQTELSSSEYTRPVIDERCHGAEH
jgi:hypothetical protein